MSDQTENPIALITAIDFFYGAEGFLSLTDKGLVQRGKLTYPEWRMGLLLLLRLRDMFEIASADLLKVGKREHGDALVDEALGQMQFPLFEAKKADAIGLIEWKDRHPDLTSEHYYVAGAAELTADERATWLDSAVMESLTPLELKRSIEVGKVEKGSTTPTGKGANSGIATIQAVRNSFVQWERENAERILHADREKQTRCLEEMQPVADFIDKLREALSQ